MGEVKRQPEYNSFKTSHSYSFHTRIPRIINNDCNTQMHSPILQAMKRTVRKEGAQTEKGNVNIEGLPFPCQDFSQMTSKISREHYF